MNNHVHLIVQSSTGKLSDTLRDFKGYTSKKILEAIKGGGAEFESRKEWMLDLFREAAGKHKRNSEFQLWTHENHAEHIYSDKFISQKLQYIHNNPVKARIVRVPEDYIYSSALSYVCGDGILSVEALSVKWKTYS